MSHSDLASCASFAWEGRGPWKAKTDRVARLLGPTDCFLAVLLSVEIEIGFGVVQLSKAVDGEFPSSGGVMMEVNFLKITRNEMVRSDT